MGALQVARSWARRRSDAGASIDWTLTNTKDAKKLLADGDVYAIVTIPKTFSKSISTVSTTTPKQADIRITTDDAHGTLVSQIGGVVGSGIASTLGSEPGLADERQLRSFVQVVASRRPPRPHHQGGEQCEAEQRDEASDVVQVHSFFREMRGVT